MLIRHQGHAYAEKFFNSATASSYGSVVRAATFGRDAAWKRRIVDIAAPEGKKVLDLACGTGILSSMVAGRQAAFVAGLDLAFEYLARNSAAAGSAVQGTAEVLPYRDGAFDAVVSSYLAKYVDVRMVLGECWRVLRSGGTVVMHDFACPSGAAMRALWDAHFALLRFLGNFVFKPWKPVFDDLDRVICQSRWAEQAVAAMQEIGFTDVSCKRYTLGTAAIVAGRKP